eukprot:SAG31_NODE_1662_length_7590_cov_24.800828_6_plen_93_part_00
MPTQMLGVAGAPIPRAPAGSMRDRLRREYRIDTPTLNRALPKIKKIDDDVTATHFAAMRLELSKRMDIMQRLMVRLKTLRAFRNLKHSANRS